MNEKPAGYLQDDNRNSSSMRLMCFFSLIGAFLFGWIAIEKGGDNGLYVFYGFLAGAFAPKAIQKIFELMPTWMKK